MCRSVDAKRCSQCSNIRFLLIFVDFDYENKYDHEKVAFTRAFWHRLVPERESERDFSRSYAFSYSKQPFWHQNVPGSTPALPRLYLGSASAANIRFLLIFVDFDYENKYDREKVAFTRAFWRLLVPERESERDFSRSYAFSYSKQPFWHQKVPGSTPALPRLYLGSASALPRLDLPAFRQAGSCSCRTSCLLYTSPSPRDLSTSRMPSSA